MFYWGDYLAMGIILSVGSFLLGIIYSVQRQKKED